MAPREAIRVFYCYAHEDKKLRDELEKHLGALRRMGQITEWHDHEISAGRDWEREIDIHLSTTNIILLLISPDFLHSEYCYQVEMKRALERHRIGNARVLPIILRPVDWENTPFSTIQVLPSGGEPVTLWSNIDEALRNVARGIRKVVDELSIQKPSGTSLTGLARLKARSSIGIIPQDEETQGRYLRRILLETEKLILRVCQEVCGNSF